MNWKYYFFDDVVSTNDVAVDYPVGSVIVANTQSNGRGRYGREWISTNGNLFVSVVLPAFDYQTHLLTFVAAISVAETLSEYGAKIKWPNDILINNGKVCGILLERNDDKVIAGIGVNCKEAPKEKMLYPTTSLKNKQDKHIILNQILNNLSRYVEIFKQSGFEPIRAKWLQYAVGIGHPIQVNLPNETVTGIFEELTPQGAISLKQSDNTTRIITVGDVFLI